MNWDAIGAIAEILGASAVFASLIYLAIQIRGSTNQASAQIFQSAAAEQSRVCDAITSDTENPSVWLKMQYGGEFNEEKRVRRQQLIVRIVHANLAFQIAYDKGQVGEEFFGDAKAQIREMFRSEHAKRAAKKYLEIQNPNLKHSEIFPHFLEPEEASDGPAYKSGPRTQLLAPLLRGLCGIRNTPVL